MMTSLFSLSIREHCFIFLLSALLLSACQPNSIEGFWDYQIDMGEENEQGILRIQPEEEEYFVQLISREFGAIEVEDIERNAETLTGFFEIFDAEGQFEGTFSGNSFSGEITFGEEQFPITGTRQSAEPYTIDRSHITYLLPESGLPETEKDIDHEGLISDLNWESYNRGSRIYNSNCINCHGNPDIEGSIPLSLKFWEQPFKAGGDPYSMYQTITRGVGSMPPQLTLTPQEKYDVIYFIQQEFVMGENLDQYVPATAGYLAGLPKGTSRGPETKPYHPWSDMDYGDFFMNTYELVDAETGPERYHSPGPTPFPDEDYSQNNFAYKGIAIRLDKGPGGVSKGKAWMMFDHDVMRVAGAWTGEGFIDWDAILLNDRHETYPRTIGKLHFETPVGPGWANPENGSFEDPRFRARDGRAFGPLPRSWADYKGLYHSGDHIVISYSVGKSGVLEEFGMEENDRTTVFTRTFHISPSNSLLKLRIAPITTKVELVGEGATLSEEDGYFMMNVAKNTPASVKLFIAQEASEDISTLVSQSSAPTTLDMYTKGGDLHYPEELTSTITQGKEDGPFAVDQLTPPFENPWAARMKLSGIDFLKDRNQAVACATDGDIWLITGLTDNSNILKWRRIGSGLFQPLGIKVLDDNIYVTCRDQLVLLRDLNGDGETDFYESFNHDHQVTDHFHEFAMGLQADKQGNLYYAKSGRHAREALIPRHGTLIKVSKDGSQSEIVATGFRAANGVCINPDGSFIVTDQQGYWNPMNRINWVEVGGEDKFYGNMWGYNPPDDTTRESMEPPMVWVDMQFDRSPSELLWVDSKKWGPLDGSLLSFSYGYGKIQLVLNEQVKGQMQGGVIDLPGIKFLTGVMRGRFNPEDGHLYACGMSAWGTSQMMRGGELYRIRYTGKTLPVPTHLQTRQNGVELRFASSLDPDKALDPASYQVNTWDLVRSSNYGSDRYNEQELAVENVSQGADGKTVRLTIKGIKPVDVMTITYDLFDKTGTPMQGTIQNTIHRLGSGTTL